jgi:TM2 domain-containing membrane protein YozV
MNNSLKGALLSGLVFPGLGQIVLKHYKRGAIIMLTVLVSLSVIIIEAVQKAFTILEKIGSEGGTIDMNTILTALLLIIFCWIIGVVDAFRIGKKKDIEQQSTDQVSNSKGN